jgi:hypothetical protein
VGLRREGGSFMGSQNEAVQTKQAGKEKRAGENSPNTHENGITGEEDRENLAHRCVE